MRKMTQKDIAGIVDLLRKWKRPPLRWERLQEQISTKLLDGETSWSRQSLQASESINTAWQAAKQRLSANGTRTHDAANENETSATEQLQAALSELQTKYDNLALRHRQLIYNASMLPGGTRLLLDPLPDNTPAQKGGTGLKNSRHK